MQGRVFQNLPQKAFAGQERRILSGVKGGGWVGGKFGGLARIPWRNMEGRELGGSASSFTATEGKSFPIENPGRKTDPWAVEGFGAGP